MQQAPTPHRLLGIPWRGKFVVHWIGRHQSGAAACLILAVSANGRPAGGLLGGRVFCHSLSPGQAHISNSLAAIRDGDQLV
jgi:hypothetical protein